MICSNFDPTISKGVPLSNNHQPPPGQPVETEITTSKGSSPIVCETLPQPQQPNLISFSPPRIDYFVGRETKLNQLAETLQKHRITVVVPTEDIDCQIGKSHLAIAFAQSRSGVIWISASSRKSLEANYRTLAHQWGIAVKDVRERLSQQQCLVVFDDARDPEMLNEFLPHGKCPVIITSRNRRWSFPQIDLGPFDIQEAVDFLCQSTGQQNREKAQTIAEDLDCLPVSLAKAAHSIGESQIPFEDYFYLKEGLLEENFLQLKEKSNLRSRNRNFTGRETTLVALEEALNVKSIAVLLAGTVGMGGMGKTQIALQYALRNVGKYKLIWRIDCTSAITIQDSYEQLAKKLGILLSDEEKKEENALIKKVNIHLKGHSRWLLIYDNAPKQEDIEGLMPSEGGDILVTSRHPDWKIHFANIFKIGVFKKKESVALIQKMTPLNNEDAEKLGELVKNLPIAVAQAAAYIAQEKISYSEFESRFKNASRELSDHQKATDEYSTTMNITWHMSMKIIDEREKKSAESFLYPYPVARPLVNLCAFLCSSQISREWLLLPWIKWFCKRDKTALEDLDRTIELLRNFWIIDLDENDVSVHTMVQWTTRNQISEADKKKICSEAVQFFALLFDYHRDQADVKKMISHRKTFPHIEALLEYAERLSVESVQSTKLQIDGASYQTMQGHYRPALVLAQKSLQRTLALKDLKFEAQARHSLGVNWQNLKQTKKAEREYSAALKIREEHFAEDQLSIAEIRSNLGSLLLELGRYQEAQNLLDRAKEVFNPKDQKLDPFKSLKINIDLGNQYRKLGNFSLALNFFEDLLQTYTSTLPSNHPLFGYVEFHIASTLSLMNKLEKAQQKYESALKILMGCYPDGHPDIIKVRYGLALTLKKLDKQEDANTQYDKIVSIQLGESISDKSLAHSIVLQIVVLQEQNKHQEVNAKFKMALEVYQRQISTPHLASIVLKAKLAKALTIFGNYVEAEKLYLNVLTPTSENEEILSHLYMVRCGYGKLLALLDRDEEAEAQYEEAIRIVETPDLDTGTSAPTMAEMRGLYGAFLLMNTKKLKQNKILQTQKLNQAREQFKKAWEILSQFVPNHKIFGEISYTLGFILVKTKKPILAIEKLKSCIPIFLKSYEPDSLLFGVIHYQIGKAYKQMGNLESKEGILNLIEASTHFEKARKIYIKRPGQTEIPLKKTQHHIEVILNMLMPMMLQMIIPGTKGSATVKFV